jgi:hypothetical protein
MWGHLAARCLQPEGIGTHGDMFRKPKGSERVPGIPEPHGNGSPCIYFPKSSAASGAK